jgi:hypothetical protein
LRKIQLTIQQHKRNMAIGTTRHSTPTQLLGKRVELTTTGSIRVKMAWYCRK